MLRAFNFYKGSIHQSNSSKLLDIPRTRQASLFKYYHNTKKVENDLMYGGLAMVTAAVSIQYTLKFYELLSKPNSSNLKDNDSPTKQQQQYVQDKASTSEETTTKQSDNKTKTNTNTTTNIWDTFFARSFYDGGFEDKMTKREAALILGVRESASSERIKDAHRRIMQINHPDKGGSAYMTAKINEAKDLLLKGK